MASEHEQAIAQLDDGVFGAVMEGIVNQDTEHEPSTIDAALARFYKTGMVIGPTLVIRAVRDGEVGVSIMTRPIEDQSDNVTTSSRDPLSQGV